MELSIRLFAGLRDRFGRPELTVEIEPAELPLTADRLRRLLAGRYPEEASAILAAFVAKNQAYAPPHEPVEEGDELALIPPVSGGSGMQQEANREHLFTLTDLPIDEGAVTAKVKHPDHGAILTFAGTTREWTEGRRTVLLEYEAYEEMAVGTMAQIAREMEERWPGTRCAITHRLGSVPPGETSVVIAVSAPRRAACYEASRYAIERLKQIVPVWKKEVWEDGSAWQGAADGPWNPLAEATNGRGAGQPSPTGTSDAQGTES
ncbi:molybdenum cofactor biosynthesis protein D/E [Paenibacillus sp. J31TS4]|uniref:molybdenum cofactor biosynthesis protein n=1 Tax=Paenibacillus sp. J31TS4 TaxID=2807195 RepID=UPI001B21092D|nr:molybdenum cofactor biosynthesis protein MoaE [Paenibacillus sp. J31TS4]GIP38279.1 molybdenum cofactor biosynthesis protein D/E [Paenibacillus sp. J31TS4]